MAKGKRLWTKVFFDINYKLYLGRSGSAVGLSAISFSASLQKDAASIPNAKGELKIEN